MGRNVFSKSLSISSVNSQEKKLHFNILAVVLATFVTCTTFNTAVGKKSSLPILEGTDDPGVSATLRRNGFRALDLKHDLGQVKAENVIAGLSDGFKVPFHRRVVETQLGKVLGGCSHTACQWLNIPFAEPFSRRFEASRTRETPYSPEGVGSATNYGPACIQNFRVGSVGRQSEDCLSLNIFAPSGYAAYPEPLPVMVWVYGGAFLTGSAGVDYSGLTFNGTRLAMHGVLVVTLQYRVGIFGFLQQPGGTGGANGFGDMINALKWVQLHIANFNGDPGQVTIFGESAGSVSVCTLSHLPAARGLFHRVIAESGSCYPSGDIILNKSEATLVRSRYLQLLGIPEQELLTMDPQLLINLTLRAIVPNAKKIPDPFTPFFISGVGQPSVDSNILPNSPWRLPTHQGLDLLHGYNSGEVRMGPPGGKFPGNALAYFGRYLGRKAASMILSQYGPDYDKIDPSYIVADACLRCNTIRYAQRVATSQTRGRLKTQVRMYVYNNPPNASFHGAEVAAVFGTTNGSWTSPDGSVNTSEALVHKIQKIWTSFAKGEDISKLVHNAKWQEVPIMGRDDGLVHAMRLGEWNQELKIINYRCQKWIAATHVIGGWKTARMCSDFYQ